MIKKNFSNETIDPNMFMALCFLLGKKYDQEAIILKIDSLNIFGVYDCKTRSELEKFEKGIVFNRIEKAYSRFVKKINVPFVFEGIKCPNCISHAKFSYRKNGFLW